VNTQGIIVWGVAAGSGTTKHAARGALTWREYASVAAIPHRDWLEILKIERNEA
jgi:hypothetical protein